MTPDPLPVQAFAPVMPPSAEARMAADLSKRAFDLARIALVSSLGLFSLLAAICLTH